MNKDKKNNGIKSSTKRDFVSGIFEAVLGLGAMIYGLAIGYPLYMYMGGAFIASGAISVGIAAVKGHFEKKRAEKEAKAELIRQGKTVDNTKEQVAENEKSKETEAILENPTQEQTAPEQPMQDQEPQMNEPEQQENKYDQTQKQSAQDSNHDIEDVSMER